MNKTLRLFLTILLMFFIFVAAGAGALLLASAAFGVAVPEKIVSALSGTGTEAADEGNTYIESFSPDDPWLMAAREERKQAAEEAAAAAAAREAAEQEAAEVQAEQERLQSYIPMDGTYEGSVTQAGGDFRVSCADEQKAVIAFAGDILFSGDYATGIQAGTVGIMNCFDTGTAELMQNADVFMLNNEFQYSTRGTAIQGKKYTLRAAPETVGWLKEMGVDIVSLANNHMFDFQEDALADTLDTLRGAGIPYIGAGENIEEASSTAYIHLLTPTGYGEKETMTIAILNATRIEQYENPETRSATETDSGVFRCYDPSLLYEKVAEADQNADFVIVYVHWGTESTHETEIHQQELAEGITGAGGDLIIGDHPHVLQGIGVVNGNPVAYSLGNFFFTSYTTDTGILQVVFDPSGKVMSGLRFVPCLQTNTAVQVLDGAEKTRVLDEMREYSASTGAGVSFDEDGWISW